MYQLKNKLKRDVALPAAVLGAIILKPGEVVTVTDEHFKEVNEGRFGVEALNEGHVEALHFDDTEETEEIDV